MSSLQVSALFVYPIKGCRGIALETMQLGERGPLWDREWMVVDAQGIFLSQRSHPLLCQVDVALTERELVVSRGAESLRLALIGEPRETVKVRVWDDHCLAVEQGGEARRFFSEILGCEARLVRLAEGFERRVDPTYAQPDDQVGFADGFPLLLATTASLNALNAALDSPVSMQRFRPNLVVDGALAWQEDRWEWARVGEVELRLLKPCGRCPVVDVEQTSGERVGDVLAGLARVHKLEGKAVFGKNCVAKSGVIAVGDRIVVG